MDEKSPGTSAREVAQSASSLVVRPPIPRWKRFFAPHAIALDYLTGLVRYRPFDAAYDLDPNAAGYLADVLQTGKLFVPAAESLNDPWEAAPALEGVWWRPDIHLEIAKFLAFLAPQRNTPEHFAKLLEETRAIGSGPILERATQLLLGHVRRSPVLSLSDRGDNFLMWSYYGRGHNGYALVFDARVLPFAGAVRVRYARRHPRILLTRRDMKGIAVDVLATKARQWRHEREWRIITSPQNARRVGFTDFQTASAAGYYATVPMESIVGVIIGDQLFKGPHKESVLELLASHVPRLRLWLAEIDRRAFRIVLRPIRFESDDSEGTKLGAPE